MTIYLGKSCSFGLPRVPFVTCRQFMCLVISLLVFRGCGICLYQFLIIAYLFTLCRTYLDVKTDLQMLVPCCSYEEELIQLHDHLNGGHLGTTNTV